MHPMLNIAVRAARAAGNVITRNFEEGIDLEISQKGDNDFVTKVDREAEQAIISKIEQSYPDHQILAEESGESGVQSDYQWIIDPLDGTANFMRGVPHFAISIAVKHKGKLEVGVIFDPIRGELFTASKGMGAQLNGFRIRVKSAKSLQGTIVATAFPHRNKQNLSNSLDAFATIFEQVSDVRRTGSAALDLAYVASGRFDGFWEAGLRVWDIAAGELIVREAGGVICDFNGASDHLVSGNIVAGNAKVVPQLVKVLK